MTLTELRYVVALAREKHFGKAATACFVSQPTLSVAIKKIEQELDVVLFERGVAETQLTEIGEKIVEQAQRILSDVAAIKTIAQAKLNPISGTLQLGMIYSIAPYLLPRIMPKMIAKYPEMQLIVQENYTLKLLEFVKNGMLDAAIVALPINEAGLMTAHLYDEDFYVAVANNHPLAKKKNITAQDLTHDKLLLLGAGHCFRDQILQANPHIQPFTIEQDGLQKTFEGTSLETLRHMAASGIGVTILPALAVPKGDVHDGLRYLPFSQPAPKRQVALVWRKNYPREAACQALAQVVANFLDPVQNLLNNNAIKAKLTKCRQVLS